MYFYHTSDVWQQFPQLVPGLLVVDGLHAQPAVADRLEPWYERARARLRGHTEAEFVEIAAWRRAYAQMGLKPTQYRSAAEALLRRFRREDDVPRLHPLVDLCNAVSLAFALPVAALDLDQIADFIAVRHATGNETHLAFSGETEHPNPGEIIFADAENHAHARRWTFRQSRRSTVGAQTRRALIVSEGLHETAATDVPRLIDALAAEIGAVWSAPRRHAVLTADEPRLDF